MKYFYAILIFMLPLSVIFALTLPQGINEQLSVQINPPVPGPRELVNIEIKSFSADLNSATISWFINDVLQKKEIGAQKHSFVNGEIGQTTKVRIVVQKRDGSVLEKSYSFKSADVDIVAEADTIVPPLYQGKALFSEQSFVNFYAIPQVAGSNGQLIPKENLIYKWKKNTYAEQDSSGYGQDVYKHQGGIITRPFELSVEVSTTEGNLVAEKSILVQSTKPGIVFYEENPIYGTMYNKTLNGEEELGREEVRFQAVPLYFTKKDNILFGWKMNGSPVLNYENTPYMTFRNEKNEDGRANIGIDITTANNILQNASDSFSLLFKKNE